MSVAPFVFERSVSGGEPRLVRMRRPGRSAWLGRVEVETKDTRGIRYPFFDSGGSVDHLGCVTWSDDEYAKIEDAMYDLFVEGLGLTEIELHRLIPECRVCRKRLGGVFEVTVAGYRVALTVGSRPAYWLAQGLNRVAWAWIERRARW